MRKAALHNLGCKVNAYETEAMEQLLEAAGYEIVSFEEKADVYVINTCSVTNVADKKSRQMLHRLRQGEIVHPGVAQRQLQKLKERDRRRNAGHNIQDQQLQIHLILNKSHPGHPSTPLSSCPGPGGPAASRTPLHLWWERAHGLSILL